MRERTLSRLRTLPRRLIWRLVVLMTLALFPLGLISIAQTRNVIQETQALRHAALLTETLAAAEGERRLIQEGIGIAEALAALVPTVPEEVCAPALTRVARANPQVVFAGFVPLDGQMTCSSAGEPVDLTGMPDFERDVRRDRLSILVNLDGAVTRQSVVILSYPVEFEGAIIGQLSVSIPHAIANAELGDPGPGGGLKLASFNPEGALIAATRGLDGAEDFLPADTGLGALAAHSGTAFRARSGDGRERLYAVAPLLEDQLYLIGSWPLVGGGLSDGVKTGLAAMVLPVLMWVAGMSVAIFGLQRLVLRHIRDMRRAMRRFALGARDKALLAFEDPPLEWAEVERDFNRMALIVTDAEARREADLQDKEVLLKEVHHRVKNNLQLIASIMNLQIRRAQSAESKRLLTSLQRRVRGLAMLHRNLYATPDMTTIDGHDLISAVVEDASSLLPDRKQRVETDLASVQLYPDQAVPLSMLIAEALTNAFKYADRSDGAPITVRLEKLAENRVQVTIANALLPPDRQPQEAGDGLGTQLMSAFIRQLDGESEAVEENGAYVFRARFTRRGFDAAEEAGPGSGPGAGAGPEAAPKPGPQDPGETAA